MATLTVWKFAVTARAAEALAALNILSKRNAIHIIDGAWLTWAPEATVPEPHHMHGTGDEEALGAEFWSHLFTVMFPPEGSETAGGEKTGAEDAAIAAIGIDERFLENVRAQLIHGSSAIFLVSEGADLDDVREALVHYRPKLIASNLPAGTEWRLRKAIEE